MAVDGERLDTYGAVQGVVRDETGESLDRVGVRLGEMGQQPGLGRGRRVGCRGGEVVEVDHDRAGRLA